MKEFFDQSEAVENLSKSILEIKMPVFQDSGRCRGYAHVTFDSKKALDAGLKLSGQKIGQRYLKIDLSHGKGIGGNPEDTKSKAEAMPESCKTLFVKNLPFEMKEDDIGDRFRPFGEVEEVRIARNWQTK